MSKIVFLILFYFLFCVQQISVAEQATVLPMAKCDMRLEHLDLPTLEEADGYFRPKENIVEIVTLNIPLFTEYLYVDASGKSVATNYAWDKDKYYRVKAMGSFSMGEPTTSKFIHADAGYIFGAGWDTTAGRNKTPLPLRIGNLLINGKELSPEQNYNTAHEYTQNIKGRDTAAIFKIGDNDYRDNQGSLLVNIEKLLDFRLTIVADSKSKADIFKALELSRNNKWREAAELINKFASESPDDYTLWNCMGVFYLKCVNQNNASGSTLTATEDLSLALSAFERAEKSANFKSAAVENNLAVAIIKNQGQQAFSAREKLNKSLKLDENFAAANYNLALLEEYMGTKPLVCPKPPVASSPRSDPVKEEDGSKKFNTKK